MLTRIRPFLWSVTDTGIVFVTREPDFDAIESTGSAIFGFPE